MLDQEIEKDGVIDDMPSLGVSEINDGAPEPEIVKADTSPQIHTLTVTQQPNGTTILSARCFDGTGWVNKNHALPTPVTAQRVAEVLLDIGNW